MKFPIFGVFCIPFLTHTHKHPQSQPIHSCITSIAFKMIVHVICDSYKRKHLLLTIQQSGRFDLLQLSKKIYELEIDIVMMITNHTIFHIPHSNEQPAECQKKNEKQL